METYLAQASDDLDNIELKLLLEGVYLHYSFDFRDYAPASIKRRLFRRAKQENLGNLSALQERLLHDPGCMERLLEDLSVTVTSMFRDPNSYLSFRAKVVPLLRTYPFIRVWNAGCATGEEAYSMAILLEEEGLYDRSLIYATDINATVLERARSGVFPINRMRDYTENYIKAGGKKAFSDYYVSGYDSAKFERSLTRNMVFAQHNLVTDGSFNEFNVIMCRNVLIYFSKPLQEVVLSLLSQSLAMFGVLALGSKESLTFSEFRECFEDLDREEKLYRKIR